MAVIGIDPHADLVAFLTEQMELSKEREPIEYEPIIKIKPEMIRIGEGSRIDSFVKLEGGHGLIIGRFVHIASFAHLGIGGGTLIIEDYACVASGGRIISGSNRPDALTMSACAPKTIQHVESYTTTLKRFSAVLAGAVVFPGVTLNEGAVLGAGSVATKDIPAWEIWGGVPARFIRKREIK